MRNRLANSLAALGVGGGQHAVIYAHNSAENIVAAAALRALGAIPVPMNHRLTAEEVAYILDDSDAATVFVGDAFLPMAERVRPGATGVKRWITLGAERRAWAAAMDDLLARGGSEPPPAPAAVGGSMVYTAGTTGKPKGALRRVTDPAAVLPRLAALDCLDPAHVHLVAGPLYHSAPGGFALYAHMVGATVVVMRKFDPEDALRHIERVERPGDVVAIRPGGKFPELAWSIGVQSGSPYHEVAISKLGNTRGVALGSAPLTGRIWLLDWTRRPLPTGGRARCAPDWSSGSSRVVCLR